VDRSVLAAFLDEFIKIARAGALAKLIAPAALPKGAKTMVSKATKLPAPASLPGPINMQARRVRIAPDTREVGRVVPRAA
jgi:hypothetical protein